MPDKTPAHAITITISLQHMRQFLGLPSTVKITGAIYDSLIQSIILRLDAPSFPTVIDGVRPTQARFTQSPKLPQLSQTTAKMCKRLEQITDPTKVTHDDILIIKATITYLKTQQAVITAQQASPTAPTLPNLLSAIAILDSGES